MSAHRPFLKRLLSLFAVALALTLCGLVLALPAETGRALEDPLSGEGQAPYSPQAACPGGPTVDGILFDECHVENFTVNGVNKTITVWYTKNQTTADREVDGNTLTLSHWINTDAQAQQVGDWGREAWQRYFEVYGHHPYDTGCNNNINVKLEQGVGWAGIAWWASPGSCWIGIDAPMVRGGGGQWVVYHEFQHYLQYSFNDGCYASWSPHYPDNAEFVEGYADLNADTVDAILDNTGYGGITYDPTRDVYDGGYGNLYSKYFAEQLGSLWTPADPHYHMDAVRDHYIMCDDRDSLYVLDSLIPQLRPGETESSFFLDFFAANWAKDWADVSTQSELIYWDDDGNPYGSMALAQNVALASGTQSWNGQTSPDTWAGRYYQVRPQSGCSFVTAQVTGQAGANLGINLMAADTVAPTNVERAGWMGRSFVRTFPGFGTYDRIAASVNAFTHQYNFDVSFTCVSPVLNILEPRQVNFAQVGDPASPIAFLARFTVKDGVQPVLGIVESQITADAEGDAAIIVPGSFQQVGEEYWMTVLPPIKPAGTTFVDLTLCLNGSICDTETDALLYVAPGSTDFALVFDGSGSMGWEDTIGEGTRLENAKKAGYVLADLLRVDDRIAVTSFSGFDNPSGCGMPGGDGNCALDIQTHLARLDVIGQTSINAAHLAIDNITAREWTPLGAGLRDGKNKLQAAPYSLNPKHIILLSDGEENVRPLWDEVAQEIIDSGVVVNTVAFSDDADETQMAQIAAQTGGSYRFVPTTGGAYAAATAQDLDALRLQGVPEAIVSRVPTAFLPGPLALDDAYEYFETEGQDAKRLFHSTHLNIDSYTWTTSQQFVEPGTNLLRLVVAAKQPHWGGCGSTRDVEVQPPGSRLWFNVSDTKSLPAGWEVRNSRYDNVVIITNPASGLWRIRTRYYELICKANGEQEIAAPQANYFDAIINGSAMVDVRLEGRFLPPVVDNVVRPGESVPIIATLMNREGAFLASNQGVLGIIERPDGIQWILLYDDGLHQDGQAQDGIFGGLFNRTDVGGTYNVRLIAYWSAAGGESVSREWNGAFWVQPVFELSFEDGMPDYWELRCGLDPNADDSAGDLDRDGLSNLEEFHRGTLPCDPDSDGGGERDGTDPNPVELIGDRALPVIHFNAQPLNALIRIQWSNPLSYTDMILYASTDPLALGKSFSMGTTGVYTLTEVTNDVTYYLTLAGMNGSAQGDFSETIAVTPKEDPDLPSGAVLINDGAATTGMRQVNLDLTAIDTPLEGMAVGPGALTISRLASQFNTVSGVTEMRISNTPSFEGVPWEPYQPEKEWLLANSQPGLHRVYAQFKDAAGNESMIVFDDILMTPNLYLPILKHR